MAKTTQSTQYAAQVAAEANFSARINDSRQIDGPVEWAFIDVATTVDNVALDVISLVELPEGVIVIPELSFIRVTDDMTSGALTIDIGDATDPDRYCDGADCAAVGEVKFLAAAIPDGYTNRYKVTGANWIITLTLATFTATIEAGAFRVAIAYKSL